MNALSAPELGMRKTKESGDIRRKSSMIAYLTINIISNI
jgi:hypothetical protein